jgi:UDP-N-acetylmuramoyl-L-alanyl-D-glutamate--2,6-diaminopimelate ligase
VLESRRLEAPDANGGLFVYSPATFALTTERDPSNRIRGKTLAQLIDALDRHEIRGDPRTAISDVTYRSGEVDPGSLFFCVPGLHVDGHDFGALAAASGASAVVVERWLDVPCAQVLVPSVRAAMGPMAAAFFDRPAERLRMVGVTGTNGKTTTTYLLESIFRAAGLSPGVIGTTGVRIDERPLAFDRTTPEAPDLQRLLAQMCEEGVDAVAMEVSSHGLDQHRVDGTRYRCAVFTNLSQDHLDYHGTMQAYFDAKARLFTPDLAERAAINRDSPQGQLLIDEASIPTVTFGLRDGSDVQARHVEVSTSGLSFEVDGWTVRSSLRGRFNIYNCLAAVAASREVGIDDGAIARGIDALPGVPGRLEPVEGGQDFAVVVDYAHTPDSLDNVLVAARGMTDGRLIVVFGCGGDRDRGKRPLMAEVATRLADTTVLTSDNPRSEDPSAIIAEIEPGARRGGGHYQVEPDRRLAIRAALGEARAGDVVVIAGKGHETGQQFADRTIPFDDRVVAAEELAALGAGGR